MPMLKFTTPEIGGHPDFFLPENFLRATIPESTDEFTEIDLDGWQVPVLTSVLEMALKFNRTAPDRLAYGHDCGVFALACATGNNLNHQVFWRDGGMRVTTQCDMLPVQEIDLGSLAQPGDILYSQTFVMDDLVQDAHLQVCATYPGEDPQVFFSKAGTGGLVGAHTLETALAMYPGNEIGVVSSIVAAPYLP